MINYDVIVIGGGVAGYSAALRCLENGLKTAVVSSGQSALHFSSGSIDLLSNSPETGAPVEFPFDEIEKLPQQLPRHPYSKLGVKRIKEAMTWYQETMTKEGLPLSALDTQANHLRITTMGTLKPTWLSQPHVQKIDFGFESLKNVKRIIMISIEGFRDFQPQIAQDNLKRYAEMNNIKILTKQINTSGFTSTSRNPNEFRSIDISRILRDESQFLELANQLLAAATPEDLVVIPSVMGNGDGLKLLNKMAEHTGLTFHEVPTMPPSLLGIRIEDVMMRAFIRNGGSLLKGDEVLGGEITEENGNLKLVNLKTQKMKELTISADHYVFATGSFFSKGIIAHQNSIEEPVFGLDLAETGKRAEWFQKSFFAKQPHAFLSFGVEADERFIPSINGQKVTNVFCAGSILSDYNPVAHGCGGGVAISTAHFAVDNILSERETEMQLKEVVA